MATTVVDVIEDLKTVLSTHNQGAYNKLNDALQQLVYAQTPDIHVTVSVPALTSFDVVEV
jgi:hypothetical protein